MLSKYEQGTHVIQIGSPSFNVFTMFRNIASAQEWDFTAHMVWWYSFPLLRGVWWATSSPNKPLRAQFEELNTTIQLSLLNFKMSNPPAQT